LQANLSAVNDTQVRLTHEQQAERAAQLQRTMGLLVHASGCNDTKCTSANCHKVKTLFKHAVGCQQKLHGGCALCRCAVLRRCMLSCDREAIFVRGQLCACLWEAIRDAVCSIHAVPSKEGWGRRRVSWLTGISAKSPLECDELPHLKHVCLNPHSSKREKCDSSPLQLTSKEGLPSKWPPAPIPQMAWTLTHLLCRRMWALLQLHAKQCQESACPVPRCRELRDARQRQATRQEALRRRGYQNMLRKQQHELQAK